MSETTSEQRSYFPLASPSSAGDTEIDYFGRYARGVAHEALRLARESGLESAVEFLSRPSNVRGYDAALEQVRNFAGLTDGWDGPGSKAPTAPIYREAVLTLLKLMLLGASPPRLLIMKDGTVGAYWKSAKVYASLDFEEDGEHLCALTDGKDIWSRTWQPGKGPVPARLWLLPAQDNE